MRYHSRQNALSESLNPTFVLTLKVLTIQGVDWYPSWHFGIGNLEHVKWWQVFHQIEKKIKRNQSCSISKRDHIDSSLLFSITLPDLFTFLTFLELFFRFWNRHSAKSWTFDEVRPPFSRSVSSIESYLLSFVLTPSKFKNPDHWHKTFIISMISIGTPIKNGS